MFGLDPRKGYVGSLGQPSPAIHLYTQYANYISFFETEIADLVS